MRAALIAAASVAIALGSAGSAFAQPSLSWHGAGAPAPGLAGVSCPSFGLCVAVAGASAYVNSAPTTGTTWTPEATDAGHTLNAISCAPGSTVCVAVGDSGAISETQNGTTWTAKSAAGESSDLTGVACPSASFCIAVDAGGDAIVSTNGGASWGSPVAIDAANDLTGVACVSSAFCAAVDSEGDIVDSSTPASPGWSLAASDGASGGLTGVACAATGSCVAIDAAGYAWASANPTSATATWSATHVAGALAAVACTAAAACVASDAGTVYASDDPAASGPAWVAQTPDASHTISGLSCTEDGMCAAVDSAGDALAATFAAPAVSTGSGTASSQTTASLSATVDPGDATLTSCYFNYGTSTSYGASVPCASTPYPGGGAQTVTAQLGGLLANTAYDFQIVASSDDGSNAGANGSLTTPAPLKAAPAISGTPAVGDTLTCSLGVTVPANLTVTYTWVRDTTAIDGATAGTYAVALADESHHLYCTATISGDGGSATAKSAYVAVPAETLGTISETTVDKPSASGDAVSTLVTCSPQAVSACTVKLKLTYGRKHKLAVGSSSAKIAAGAQVKVTVRLNATGRSLLASHHGLKVTLTVSGTVVGVISGTIKRQTVKLAPPRHARRGGR